MSSHADRRADALVRRFVELAWNRGDEAASAALLATAFTHHDLVTYAETGAEGYLRSILTLRAAFSPIRLEIHDTVSGEGQVASRWTAVGTHRATGAAVRVNGISIDRVADGRIAENWTAWDRLGLERQLPGLLTGGSG